MFGVFWGKFGERSREKGMMVIVKKQWKCWIIESGKEKKMRQKETDRGKWIESVTK